MDRETIIKLSNLFYIEKEITLEFKDLLIDYCCNIHDKKEEDVEKLWDSITNNNTILLGPILSACLDYYNNKYNIIKIFKDKKLLKIY